MTELPQPRHEPSWFWRLFGGTLLSLLGLLLVTIFSLAQSRVADLQNEVTRVSRDQADCVKQADLGTKLSNIWTQIREQAAIKQHAADLKLDVQRLQEECKSQSKDIQALRERIAVLEGKLQLSNRPAAPSDAH